MKKLALTLTLVMALTGCLMTGCAMTKEQWQTIESLSLSAANIGLDLYASYLEGKLDTVKDSASAQAVKLGALKTSLKGLLALLTVDQAKVAQAVIDDLEPMIVALQAGDTAKASAQITTQLAQIRMLQRVIAGIKV